MLLVGVLHLLHFCSKLVELDGIELIVVCELSPIASQLLSYFLYFRLQH